jgi:benzoate membrane transport protein
VALGQHSFFRDLSPSTVVAGFVAVLVGFTSSVAIVFAAASALGATAAQTASWMWALGLGMGLTSIGLSLWYREPVLTAWSTPGAALIAGTSGVSLSEGVGAFVVCGLLIVAAGATGWFERVMNRIPQAVAAALLAGVLARFGLDAVLAVRTAPTLVLTMAAVFLLARRGWPRYAVVLALMAGVLVAAVQGQLALGGLAWQWAQPVWTTPTFTLTSLVSLALPLFVVTMASQNLPGVAAQRAAGYQTPVSMPVAATGLASTVLGPFGGYAFNLAAITAAICQSPSAHEDPAKRYTAAVCAGALYVVVGLGGGVVVHVFQAFPRELVLAIAGLALLGTIANALAQALRDEPHREAAGLTFLVTLSGVTALGVGSAFWGVVAGSIALAVQQLRPSGRAPRA